MECNGTTDLYHSKESLLPNVFDQSCKNKRTPVVTQWKVYCLSFQIAPDSRWLLLSLTMACFDFSFFLTFALLTRVFVYNGHCRWSICFSHTDADSLIIQISRHIRSSVPFSLLSPQSRLALHHRSKTRTKINAIHWWWTPEVGKL